MACVVSVLVWQSANGWWDKKLCPCRNYMYTLLSLRSALQRSYRQSIWHRVRARSRIIDQKSHYFSLIVVFFSHYFPHYLAKFPPYFPLFFCTVPDALYPLHVVFDILVNEYQFTFIFVTLFGKTDTNTLPFKRGNRLLSV